MELTIPRGNPELTINTQGIKEITLGVGEHENPFVEQRVKPEHRLAQRTSSFTNTESFSRDHKGMRFTMPLFTTNGSSAVKIAFLLGFGGRLEPHRLDPSSLHVR
ncbi:MAG: hypothetical protein R3B54_15225 [Bdellovibrionota bacterium]